jgi:hypothetical protein
MFTQQTCPGILYPHSGLPMRNIYGHDASHILPYLDSPKPNKSCLITLLYALQIELCLFDQSKPYNTMVNISIAFLAIIMKLEVTI